MNDRDAVEAALVDAHRREWAFVLAATVRVLRDLDLAEECVQDAYTSALTSWAEYGVPVNPAAWLTVRWNQAAISEAHELIIGVLARGEPGRYVLQAAIASLYAQAPSFAETDWAQIVRLYDRLLQVWPSPVVALNRAIPLAEVAGPAAALAEVEALARTPVSWPGIRTCQPSKPTCGCASAAPATPRPPTDAHCSSPTTTPNAPSPPTECNRSIDQRTNERGLDLCLIRASRRKRAGGCGGGNWWS